jgi:hypothetical protein
MELQVATITGWFFKARFGSLKVALKLQKPRIGKDDQFLTALQNNSQALDHMFQ